MQRNSTNFPINEPYPMDLEAKRDRLINLEDEIIQLREQLSLIRKLRAEN